MFIVLVWLQVTAKEKIMIPESVYVVIIFILSFVSICLWLSNKSYSYLNEKRSKEVSELNREVKEWKSKATELGVKIAKCDLKRREGWDYLEASNKTCIQLAESIEFIEQSFEMLKTEVSDMLGASNRILNSNNLKQESEEENG